MTRRFLHHAFTLSSALSLLLCIATCFLWPRSYRWSDQFIWTHPRGQRSILSNDGHLFLSLFRADWSRQPQNTLGLRYQRDTSFPTSAAIFGRLYVYPDPRNLTVTWNGAGFGYQKFLRYDGVRNISFAAPFWSIALATVLLPVAWITRRLRSRRRHGPGLCPSCGYDLRASPAKCPECGTIPT
jgi:hypothetical protein